MTDRRTPRSQPTAADSWVDGEPIDFETFVELYDVLQAHGKYKVRPALQIKHDDAAVVKTVDTLANAEETAANLRHKVMMHEAPFVELSDEQIALLAGHDFAADSRDEVPHEVPDDDEE